MHNFRTFLRHDKLFFFMGRHDKLFFFQGWAMTNFFFKGGHDKLFPLVWCSIFFFKKLPSSPLCIRQRKPWTPPPQGSTQMGHDKLFFQVRPGTWQTFPSWIWCSVYFQGLVNLDLINFLTVWIFTLCEFRPGESWTNVVYISSENVLNTKNWFSPKMFC